MSQRSSEYIKDYLQQKDVQQRIQDSMQEARDNATVTISRAASLFGFTEPHLREWDKRGLLKAERSLQEGKGHRQYSTDELDKLAVIHELLKGGYTPTTIPLNFYEIWQTILTQQQDHHSESQQLQGVIPQTEHLPLDKRAEQGNREAFWRYFVSQALRLSLLLICEDIPETIAALILPMEIRDAYNFVYSSEELPNAGKSLIGWLGPDQSFYTFLDDAPSFEFHSDFRLERLTATEEDTCQDNTFIVVQRKVKPLPLSPSLVKTVRRLLEPVYRNFSEWRSCFDYGMRDWMYQVVDFKSLNSSDDVLNGLANMVVELGGKTVNGNNLWDFCCILLPNDASLPLQQRSLMVQAQSKQAPHTIAKTTVSPEEPSLSLKAFQSGSIIYRPEIADDDPIIAYHVQEGPIRSAIAIPVGGEDGLSTAAIYVTSSEANAFSEDDQRLLRIISRMVEELLLTYRARQQTTGRLIDLINNPTIVDTSFKEFKSENDFINDLELLLTTMRDRIGFWGEPRGREDIPVAERAAKFWADSQEGALSFIAVEIDGQTSRANKYGDRITRNLSRAVGLRIQGQLTPFEKYKNRELYHVYADRFYLLLDGIPLDEARAKAEKLRQTLKGTYRIPARPGSIGRPMLPDSMLELPDVTVRLGVAAYPYPKVRELLRRYPFAEAVSAVRSVITNSIDGPLVLGRREGGDVVISFVPEIWDYARWFPGAR